MRPALAVITLVMASLAWAACGGDDGGQATTGQSTAPPAATSPAKASAVELGKMVYDDYVAMHTELRTLFQGDPPAAALAPKVNALRDRYIEKFVAYGRQREALPQGERGKVDTEVLRLLTSSPPSLDAMNAAIARFNSSAPELARQITSLNILTQYAFFDLLKKQEPGEAKRLGID